MWGDEEMLHSGCTPRFSTLVNWALVVSLLRGCVVVRHNILSKSSVLVVCSAEQE